MAFIGNQIITLNSLLDLDGQELVLDADADTTIHVSTDDQIDFKIAGTDFAKMSDQTLTLTSATASRPGLLLLDTNADANPPFLRFQKDSASPADNDEVGVVQFYADDDGGNVFVPSQIKVVATDVSNGSEDGKMTISTTAGGSLTDTLVLESGNTTVSGTLASTGVVTANAGVVVDNITIDGTEIDLSSGDLTLDVAGDLVVNADGGNLVFQDDSVNVGELANSSSDFVVAALTQDKDIIFKGNDGGSTIEAARFDISDTGILRIGNTSGTLFDSNSATGIVAGTSLQVSTSGSTVGFFNRLSSDGVILGFYRDGTAVGRIGSISDNIFLANSTTGGLKFGTSGGSTIVDPTNESGAVEDATHDLGSSGGRWRNLYLSGGLYVGGTGSANYLEDYEEGTWTPAWGVVSGSIGTFGSLASGRYTKVGRLVHIQGYISYGSNSSASGAVTVTGLPFTSTSSGFGQSDNQSGGITCVANTLWSSDCPEAGRIPASSTNFEPVISTATGSTQIEFADFSTGANHSQLVFFGTYIVNT